MILTKLQFLNFRTIINFLLLFLPISFIAGNLLINLNIILIILASLIYWKKEFFKIDINLIDKLLIVVFFYAIIISLINFGVSFQNDMANAKENLLKSITYLRYLLFYFSIRHIIEKNFFDFKIFFLSSGLCVIFVSLDLILQLIRGTDIFGFPKATYKLSGPFGDEQIAGSYLQRFSIFLFFLFPFYREKINIKYLFIIFSLLFLIIFFSIVFSGNRMPIVMFMFSFFLLFLLEKKLRKFLIIFAPLVCLMLLIVYNMNHYVYDIVNHFVNRSFEIFKSFDKIFYDSNFDLPNTYIKEFNLGYLTWRENTLLGGGINSFYLNCEINYNICSTHPHNYYLEILAELGILGTIFILLIFVNLFYKYLIIKKNLNLNFYKNLVTPFALLLFVEIFPIKTTGSFFSTGSAAYIFLLISVIVGLFNKSKYHRMN